MPTSASGAHAGGAAFPPPVPPFAGAGFDAPAPGGHVLDLDASSAGPVLDLDAVGGFGSTFDFPAPSTPASLPAVDFEAYDLDAPVSAGPTYDLDAPVVSNPAPAAPTSRRAAAAAVQEPATTSITPQLLEQISLLNPGTGLPDADIVAALHEVIHTGASDLHVSSGAHPLLRVDGGLSAIPETESWDRDKVKAALYSLMTEKGRERFEEELELDFAYTLNESARFRVNFYQDRGAMGAALRIIPTRIKTLKELGISPEVGHFSTLPRGLVLVTGPTGSGKSTTLAALIDLVNETRRDHVVTVEDPIEFLHRNKRSLINQREVGRDTHSFNNALKHVLRQDPDVILIGELRDLETISVALTAAETGHLVFATLHTQSAPTTIDRVIDVFPPHQQDQVRTQLAATLKGVVCQTLVKKANGSGRSVATEVMFTTPAISNLVREGKTYQITSALQSGSAQGMHTMDQALAELVNEGTITKAVALEKSQDAETLERLITRVDMGGGDSMFVHDGIDGHLLAQEGRR
ncbi:MAG: type IV pilus twitching motility protein PilT [Micrococcales bacterium]|nr:type IV pilus twitching motility protein PilT [Micrococcales bacterium]